MVAGRIKGAAIREFVGWLQADLGAEELVRIVGRISSPTYRHVFDVRDPHLGILAASWYDAQALHALLDALGVGRGRAELSRLAQEGAKGALEKTLTGVHRAILRIVGSPELHARFCQRLWSTYYEDGLVQSVRIGPRSQRIAYSAWRSHHPLLCELTTASDLVVFPLMGLTGVRVAQETCINQGQGDCAHLVEWD